MTQQQKTIAPLTPDSNRSNENTFASNSSHSRRFQQSGKGKPCPICDRTKDSDCRWNNEVVLCHTHVDRDAQIEGYVYRGVEGIWGQYFPVQEPISKPSRPKAKQKFIYPDKDGHPLVQVTRIDDGDGKKRFFQSHWNGWAWIAGVPEEIRAKLRLYRIDDPINQAAIATRTLIILVEGEGIVDLLLKMGIASTTAIGGAGKWKHYGYPNYCQDLAGAVVVLCPDRDNPGVKHCLEIEQDFPEAQWLYAFPDSPLWDNLPTNRGLDIVDWIAAEQVGGNQILGAVGPKRSQVRPQPSDATEAQPKKKNISQRLLELASPYHYFHTPDQRAYVDVEVNGVRQTFPVRHKTFKLWLSRNLFRQDGKTAGSETLNQALTVLESRACFDEEEREVYLRLAEQDGTVYIDLGTDDWRAIAVSAEGWEVISNPPVRFRRSGTTLPLPIPEQGGMLAELRSLLNVDDDSWVLVVCWLLFCFYPRHPHPILVIHGEPGTGKTFAARLLQGLIDPRQAPLIPKVADLRDLAIAAWNRWVLAYDNLSYLTVDQSDALCRICTGGGFLTRALYENEEETVFEFNRPQIVTGIDSLASRGDLLERSLLVELRTIDESQRLTDEELTAKLERARGLIFGALLTALSKTLKVLPTVEVDRLPRMADFAKFAIAAETALDLPVGSFLRVYTGNRQEAHETAVESSPVAVAIMRLMQDRDHWQGTPTELLQALEALVDEKTTKKPSWAGTARALGKALTRLAANLRGIGLNVIRPPRGSSNRWVRIEKTNQQTSQTSQTSELSQAKPADYDVNDGDNVKSTNLNVTDDVTEQQSCPNVTANVTAESPLDQDIQPIREMNDVCDKSQALFSSWVGKVVGKRGKHGWRGTFEGIEGKLAQVQWFGDPSPSWVDPDELEIIKDAA
ncbi:MAG: hypothetical protein KME47_10615 [Nodosilinea sp. WJT8-NPBG4]|jgi:hypothetical protein|nr:hypothetical protein [Nodosilinea sp. WJT8-NPBG4]